MSLLVVLLACLTTGALASEGDDDGGPTGSTMALPYGAKPVVVPYRSVAGDLPAPGFRYIRPQPPMRRFRGPNWLQRALDIPDAPPPDLGTDPTTPSSQVVEPQITARNLPEPGPRAEAYADEEIVVWGDRLEQARAAVTRRMRSLGYEEGPSKNGKTVWKPAGAHSSWKPVVTIDDDGWFDAKAKAVSGFTPTATAGVVPGQAVVGADSQAGNAVAPPVPTAGVKGQIAGKRVRMHAEAKITRQVWDVVAGLGQAHADNALIDRLEELPDELDALWHDGVSPGGQLYLTNRERQQALLTLWATRTPTRSGETVRRKIGDYLVYEVHDQTPIPPTLIAEAERRCGCLLFR